MIHATDALSSMMRSPGFWPYPMNTDVPHTHTHTHTHMQSQSTVTPEHILMD